MLKKFRNLVCLALVLVVSGVTLAGCALFQKDAKYDHGQIVARVNGTSIEITKKQLSDAFQNYGYQYVSEQSLSIKDAYDQTLESLINREILALESVRMFGNLTDEEIRNARKTSYSAVEESFKQIETEMREKVESGTIETPTEPTEEASEPVKYNKYEKYVVRLSDGSYALNLEKYRNTSEGEYVYADNDEFLDYLQTPRSQSANEKNITARSFNRIADLLASAEKGVGQVWNESKQKFEYKSVKNTTNAEKRATVNRELVRIQKEEERNTLVRRLQETFDLGFGRGMDSGEYTNIKNLQNTNFDQFSDLVSNANTDYVNDLVNMATADFRDKVRNAIYRHDNGFNGKTPEELTTYYTTQLLDKLGETYYVPSHINGKSFADEFFTVSHILLGYNEDETAQYTTAKTLPKTCNNVLPATCNGVDCDHCREVNLIRSKMRIEKKNAEGTGTDEFFSPTQVLNEVRNYVQTIPTTDMPKRAERFREMIYAFNTDPGMQNPEFEYVIGKDVRTTAEKLPNSGATDTRSRMVPEFTENSRELFAQEIGSISDRLIWTDYGAHIIMYTRNVSDFIYTNSSTAFESISEEGLNKFLHATQTSYGNKTYFDSAVERVTKPAYSSHEQRLLTDYKETRTVTYYKSKYKNLTKAN